MAHFVGASPLAIAHLGNQLWLDPVHTFLGQNIVRSKRVVGAGKFVQLLTYVTDGLVAEAGTHPAGELKAFIPRLIIANQEGAEAAHSGCAFGESPDDQFLLANAFELQPTLGAAMLVAGVGILGNDAFKSLFTGFGQ